MSEPHDFQRDEVVVVPSELALARVPRAPRQPSARARELIFRYQGSQKAVLLCGALFFAVGCLFSLTMARDIPAELLIDASSVAGRGTVTWAKVDHHISVNHRNPLEIRFHYLVGGRAYDGTSYSYDPQQIDSVRVGDELPLEISRVQAAWSRVKDTNYAELGRMPLFMLLFPSVGALMMFFAIRSNRREIRAFTDGTAVWAKVVFAGEDKQVRINNRHPYKVQWQLTIAGTDYKGSISSMSATAIADLMEAKDLIVLYDPMNPDINTCYIA